MNTSSFQSRWGLIFASLGMAVGAGNLWRFPRLAGQYGGTFLLIWILWGLVWSIPILLAEFSIGKNVRGGVIRSYSGMTGQSFTWMGFFIATCSLAICFHYSVVTSWSLSYLWFSIQETYETLMGGMNLSQKLAQNPQYLVEHWEHISTGNPTTAILHFFSIGLGLWLLYSSIHHGLEKANRIMIPTMFGLLLLIGGVALSSNGGIKGLEYMFHINPAYFADPKVWLEALAQSAWSTGAGWGLVMTIASYSRDKEDVTLNTFISAFGDNTASLLAGMAILSAVFAMAASDAEALGVLQSGNQALTFMAIPKLFTQLPAGSLLSALFFLVFFLAAFSSLLPMYELALRIWQDLGLDRKRAVLLTALLCMGFGMPAALSLEFFNNQDWVWGVGLIVSGLFLLFAVLKKGVVAFKQQYIDADSDFKVPNLYFAICIPFNVLLGIVLIWWWMSRGYSEYPWFDAQGNWNLTDTYSNASIVTQWGFLLLMGIVLNNWLYRKFWKK